MSLESGFENPSVFRPESASAMRGIKRNEEINSMNDEEIDQKFKELLLDSFQSDLNVKDNSNYLSIYEKKRMLTIGLTGSNLHTVQHYISCLENFNKLTLSDILACLESLRIALTNYTVSWLREFGTKGLQAILDVLEFATKSNGCDTSRKIQLECLKCIMKFIVDTEGLKEFVREESGHVIVANCVDYRKPSVMIAALKILALLCVTIKNDGVLFVLEKSGEIRKCNRFLPIIEGMTMTSDDNLWDVCLWFINILLSEINDVELRMYIRNEIISTGLYDILNELKNHPAGDINEQFSIFCKTKEADKLQLQLSA